MLPHSVFSQIRLASTVICYLSQYHIYLTFGIENFNFGLEYICIQTNHNENQNIEYNKDDYIKTVKMIADIDILIE